MKKTLLFAFCLFTFGLLHAQVIDEIYGGGGNSGAQYNRDYVVITGTAGTSLAGWSIQYASSTGNFNGIVNLSGTIAANGVYHVCLASGATGAAYPFTCDVTSAAVNLSATNGKVALANNTTAVVSTAGAVTPGTGSFTNVVDFVGYGTANQYVGTATAPSGSNTTSLKRVGSTGNNSADFVTQAPNPLPVELSSFTAKTNNDQVNLAWTTVSETNNAMFEVERSNDGRTFKQIAELKGAGNSLETVNYAFNDKAPLAGKSYYRLRQVDFEGTFSYSDVVSVDRGTKIVKVTPNPVSNGFRLEGLTNNDPATVRILALNGQLLLETIVMEGEWINVPATYPGMYLLQVEQNETFSVNRIMINN